QPAVVGPSQELSDGLGVGSPGVGVRDVGGEEFEEPLRRPLAGVGDEGGDDRAGRPSTHQLLTRFRPHIIHAWIVKLSAFWHGFWELSGTPRSPWPLLDLARGDRTGDGIATLAPPLPPGASPPRFTFVMSALRAMPSSVRVLRRPCRLAQSGISHMSVDLVV